MKKDSFDRVKYFYNNYESLDIDEIKQFREDCDSSAILNRKKQIYLKEQRIKEEIRSQKNTGLIKKIAFVLVLCLPILLVSIFSVNKFFSKKENQLLANKGSQKRSSNGEKTDTILSQHSKIIQNTLHDTNDDTSKKSGNEVLQKNDENRIVEKIKVRKNYFSKAEIEEVKNKISSEYLSLIKNYSMSGEDELQIYPTKTKIFDINDLVLFSHSGYDLKIDTFFYFLTDKNELRLTDTLISYNGILDFSKLNLFKNIHANPFYVEIFDNEKEYFMSSEIIKSNKKNSLPHVRELKSIDDFLVASYKLKEAGYFSKAFQIIEMAKKEYGNLNEFQEFQRILIKQSQN